jgi:hypothetical protein
METKLISHSKSRVKSENYFRVYGWMLNDLQLKGNDLLVYAVVYGFSLGKNGWYNGSIKYLSDYTGASRRTVMDCLKTLTNQGLLIKQSESKRGMTLNRYRCSVEIKNMQDFH